VSRSLHTGTDRVAFRDRGFDVERARPGLDAAGERPTRVKPARISFFAFAALTRWGRQ
jgi:hypothetical protein